MMRFDDEMLIAYADGELHGARRAEIERALAEDPGLRRRLAAQQQLRARIAGHYAPVAEEPVPDRFAAMIRRSSAGNDNQQGVADLAAARARRRPIAAWRNLAALAATFVFALLLGQALPPIVGGGSDSGPVAAADGMLLARGTLAAALDGRLAADPAGPDEIRIGVSFAAADGRFCRTFDGAAMSGLACRGDSDWQLVATAPGAAATGEYRQASSGNALVLAAAQEMMAGEPLDAEGERRARAAGWKRD